MENGKSVWLAVLCVCVLSVYKARVSLADVTTSDCAECAE